MVAKKKHCLKYKYFKFAWRNLEKISYVKKQDNQTVKNITAEP